MHTTANVSSLAQQVLHFFHAKLTVYSYVFTHEEVIVSSLSVSEKLLSQATILG